MSKIIQASFFVGKAPPPTAIGKANPARATHLGAGTMSWELSPASIGLVPFGGQPLPQRVLQLMESAFRADLKSVRVHVGPQAQKLGARAFTIGNDIYFAQGQYQPDTPIGRQLLGHELAHVLQQRAGRVHATTGATVSLVSDSKLEAEADSIGRRIAGTSVQLMQRKQAPQLSLPSARQVPQRTIQLMKRNISEAEEPRRSKRLAIKPDAKKSKEIDSAPDPVVKLADVNGYTIYHCTDLSVDIITDICNKTESLHPHTYFADRAIAMYGTKTLIATVLESVRLIDLRAPGSATALYNEFIQKKKNKAAAALKKKSKATEIDGEVVCGSGKYATDRSQDKILEQTIEALNYSGWIMPFDGHEEYMFISIPDMDIKSTSARKKPK